MDLRCCFQPVHLQQKCFHLRYLSNWTELAKMSHPKHSCPSVVWCGVVWCGVVWCGVVCGVVCSVVWCGVGVVYTYL